MLAGASWETTFIINSLSELRIRPAVEPDMSTAREIRHCENGLGPPAPDPASCPTDTSRVRDCSLWVSFPSCGDDGGE